MNRKAFTLIELLLVVAIMGLMGTAAVGGYRAMQRGMEERGVMQNVNQFIRSAYQRAQIDRVPVSVYFWNETLREETETETLVVVGKAVAVRRAGRVSEVDGDRLYDEFGDLRFYRFSLDEESESLNPSQGDKDNGMYLYPMSGPGAGGSQMKRSVVAQVVTHSDGISERLDPGDRNSARPIEMYAFQVLDGSQGDWKRGMAYGLEFAELQLPHNYIFGGSYSRQVSKPVTDVKKLAFKPGVNSGSGSQGGISGDDTVTVSSLRPGASGELAAEKVDVSKSPTKDLN